MKNLPVSKMKCHNEYKISEIERRFLQYLYDDLHLIDVEIDHLTEYFRFSNYENIREYIEKAKDAIKMVLATNILNDELRQTSDVPIFMAKMTFVPHKYEKIEKLLIKLDDY